MNAQLIDSALIDALGGTSKVATLCCLTTGAVSQWRSKGIPKPWKKFLRLAESEVFEAWASDQSLTEDLVFPAAAKPLPSAPAASAQASPQPSAAVDQAEPAQQQEASHA